MIGDINFQSLSHRDNASLNARLRAIATRQADKQVRPHRVLARSAQRARPARPSGLRLTPALGKVCVSWNPVSLGSLYELQVSTENQFPNPRVVRTGHTDACLDDLDPTLRYYFRVRALGVGSSPGEFSAVLDTLTGLATFSHLDFQAATSVYEASLTSFDPADFGTENGVGKRNVPAYYEFSERLVTRGGVLLPFMTIQLEAAGFNTSAPPYAPSIIEAALMVDNQVENSLTNHFAPNSGPAGDSPTAITGLGDTIVRPAGTYRMGVRFDDLSTHSSLFFHGIYTPVVLRLEVVELLR